MCEGYTEYMSGKLTSLLTNRHLMWLEVLFFAVPVTVAYGFGMPWFIYGLIVSIQDSVIFGFQPRNLHNAIMGLGGGFGLFSLWWMIVRCLVAVKSRPGKIPNSVRSGLYVGVGVGFYMLLLILIQESYQSDNPVFGFLLFGGLPMLLLLHLLYYYRRTTKSSDRVK